MPTALPTGRMLTPDEMLQALSDLADFKEWQKDLRRTYRTVATVGVRYARAEMRSGDRQLAAVAGRVRPAPTALAARVGIPGGRVAAAVYGTRRPTGWLGNAAHKGTSARNNPKWVGNTWTVAVAGQGPRGVNTGLAKGEGQILDAFETSAGWTIDRAFRGRALPR